MGFLHLILWISCCWSLISLVFLWLRCMELSRGFLNGGDEKWNELKWERGPLYRLSPVPTKIYGPTYGPYVFHGPNIRSVCFSQAVCLAVDLVQRDMPFWADYTARHTASIICTASMLGRILPSGSEIILVVSFDLRSLWNLLNTCSTLQYHSKGRYNSFLGHH